MNKVTVESGGRFQWEINANLGDSFDELLK